MTRLIATLAICFFAVTIVGETKRADFDSKHLETRYEKFRDQMIVSTKPMNTDFIWGKKHYLCSMAVGYGVKNGVKSSIVILYAPGGSGFLAGLVRAMDPEVARVFFSPNADVILLVDGKRYPLKRIDGVAFAPNGSTLVAAEVPSEGVEAIRDAERWDMAVGALEAHYGKRATNYYRDKFKAIVAQYAKDSQPTK